MARLRYQIRNLFIKTLVKLDAVFKGIQLKWLFLRYRGKDNVPSDKLGEWLTSSTWFAKGLEDYSEDEELEFFNLMKASSLSKKTAEVLGKEMSDLRACQLLGDFMHRRIGNETDEALARFLLAGPKENLLDRWLQLCLVKEDIRQHQVSYLKLKINSP